MWARETLDVGEPLGVHDPLRVPPTAARRGGGGERATGLPAAVPVIHLDARAERIRASAEQLLQEPVATVVVGRGLPPRKWPPVLAIIAALIGAALVPVSGAGPIVFWTLAVATAVLWRQYQEGHLPPGAPRPAGALVVTPTQLALVGVHRGWFDTDGTADELLASEPLHAVALRNRPGWGHLDVGGRRLHLDDARRTRRVDELNALIASVAAGGWQPPLHHRPAGLARDEVRDGERAPVIDDRVVPPRPPAPASGGSADLVPPT